MKRLTPEDIFNKDFKHVLRGYDIEEVNEFLDLVIQSYEDVLEENEYLKEQVKKLKKGGGKPFPGRSADPYDPIIKEILVRLEKLEKIVFR
ncbi:DivIVA domain-containing protein [Thermoactinomyces mirandus]|uniref:DivIVA domain-containing protein n=1 Tax=Thermoactinomyces mirandus TaxID=2756294 RepID=A0A7W1XTV3_9BACL|nr:DivIVA domain-containing protein [Thermoactinomyces mirandus]MBA4603136.1 DivIVA domain-containing protein [Thermoactinomyces mirandus]